MMEQLFNGNRLKMGCCKYLLYFIFYECSNDCLAFNVQLCFLPALELGCRLMTSVTTGINWTTGCLVFTLMDSRPSNLLTELI